MTETVTRTLTVNGEARTVAFAAHHPRENAGGARRRQDDRGQQGVEVEWFVGDAQVRWRPLPSAADGREQGHLVDGVERLLG